MPEPSGKGLIFTLTNVGRKAASAYSPQRGAVGFEIIRVVPLPTKVEERELWVGCPYIADAFFRNVGPSEKLELTTSAENFFQGFHSGRYLVRVFYSDRSVNMISEMGEWGRKSLVGYLSGGYFEVTVSATRNFSVAVAPRPSVNSIDVD